MNRHVTEFCSQLTQNEEKTENCTDFDSVLSLCLFKRVKKVFVEITKPMSQLLFRCCTLTYSCFAFLRTTTNGHEVTTMHANNSSSRKRPHVTDVWSSKSGCALSSSQNQKTHVDPQSTLLIDCNFCMKP